jgi:cysteinyl-tRNA synthetase
LTALQIHNTLTRAKEPFVPRVPGKVTMYVCGPTVYDYFHVGNARTFTTFDMVVRWLRASGLEVKYARNITDIDDKIMERARANGEPLEVLTQRMVDAFIEDTDRLGLVRPNVEPRATKYVEPMLEMIGVLEQKGNAYRGSNGDVFYAVRSFPGYGKLSRRNLDDLRAGERVAVEAAKKDPLDFVLWKAAKPGEARWNSPYGDGRPGWHIECSAMSCRELGASIDIHGGGWDLQFPHHENEIAQSEAANGKPFAAYWMHGAFLNMDHAKMSKSLGNFFTTRDVLDKLDAVQGPEQLRYFFLHGHYRSEVEYTAESVEDAGASLRGLYTALRDVAPATAAIPAKAGAPSIDWTDPHAARFRDAMNDDFDTPVAFAVLHDLRNEVNRGKSPQKAALLKALGGTIGLLQAEPAKFLQGGAHTAADVDALLRQRREARDARDFARADAIRKQIEAMDIILEDKPDGTTLWRKK